MGGIFLLLLFAISAVAFGIGIFGIIKTKGKNYDNTGYVVSSIAGGFFGFVFGIMLIFSSFTIIDAGDIGIPVKFGKVVEGVSYSGGMNGKSIFASVKKYSIRINEYTISSDPEDGKKGQDDTIKARTQDNLLAAIEATYLWKISSENPQFIYQKVGKNMNEIENLVIRTACRNATLEVVANKKYDEHVTSLEATGVKITESINNKINKYGLILENVMIKSMTPPPEVDSAIQKKLARQQELEEQTSLESIAIKQASIQAIKAGGVAEAQDIIQKKLTPLYVQYEAIQAYKELANSDNTTFVIMPTSPSGAGMPLILGAK